MRKIKELELENQQLREEIEELVAIKRLMIITCRSGAEKELEIRVTEGLQKIGRYEDTDVLILPDSVTSVSIH